MFNAAGGIVWACVFGIGGYSFGKLIDEFAGPIGIALLVLAVIGGIISVIIARRHEEALIERAERAFPGPLKH
jgi:membrane protein DedA with SNARE-associated domain